jgi:hypothetical protein
VWGTPDFDPVDTDELLMDVFCSDDQRAVLDRSPDAVPRVLPLPVVVDASVVVLLHLLLREQWTRPVLLDASGLREVCPGAALLLAATLDARARHGAPVHLVGLNAASRRIVEQVALGRYATPASAARRVSPPPLRELHIAHTSVTIS